MENVKVGISLVVFDKLDCDLIVIVSERAIGTVLALLLGHEVGRAELRFVLVGVVELFHSVVSKLTLVLVRAFFLVHQKLTALRLIIS